MFKPYSSCVWPVVAVVACSSGSPALTPNGNGGSGGSTAGSQNAGSGTGSVSGSTSGIASSGAANSGASGNSSGPVIDAGTGGSETDAAVSQEAGASDAGSTCSGLFCEDFEEGQLDSSKWDVQIGAGGIQLVQQQTVAHGKYAWHVHGTGARGDFATILTKHAPMALQGAGPVFGRLYVYATANYGSHIQLGFAGTTRDATIAPSVTTNGMNFNYMEFAEFANSWQLGFDLFAPAAAVAKGFVEEASYPPARDQYPVKTWSCIEWEFGDNPDMMLLWVDGKQMDQFDVQHIDYTSASRTPGSILNGQSSTIIGGFAFFGFGFHSWGDSAVVDRYYDDIVLDTKRVGCIP